jgi:GNAT superfamily N-acetyltransferase
VSARAATLTAGNDMEFLDDPIEEQVAEIDRGLDEFSATVATVRSAEAIRGVYVDNARVIAGVTGAVYWGKLHIRLLWVHEDYRAMGLGSRLVD